MHVVHRLGLGGAEFGVAKVLNHLDRARFAPSVCSLRGSLPEWRAPLRPDVRHYELDRNEGLDPALFVNLARIMTSERIQIVHSHNWSTFIYAVVAARLARVPIVIQGEHGRETSSPEVSRVRLLAERILARMTDHFTTVSRDLAEHIHASWGVSLDRIRYIPNGVDLKRFGVPYPREAIRASFGVTPDEPLIGSVGAFRAVKDFGTLIRAFALVKQACPAAKLILVGLDVEDQFRRSIATEIPDWGRLSQSILFPGIRPDIPEILSALDVYVCSSIYEGMSNTILEAMASRAPVVATSVGGTPYLVTDGATGLLAPPRDPAAIADRVLILLRNPELARRLGEAGRAGVERFHSFLTMVEGNASLYESLVARRSVRLRPAHRLRVIAAGALHVTGLLRSARALMPSALTIVCYHRVLPLSIKKVAPGQAMLAALEVFERQTAQLAARYRPLSLPEVARHLREHEPFPRGAVWVTFDDGYADNYEHAYPVLQRFGVPATLFLTTGPIDTGEWLWWDDVADALRGLWPELPRISDWSDSIYPAPLRDLLRAMALLPSFSIAASDQMISLLNGLAENARDAVVRNLRDRAAAIRPEERPRLMLTWDQIREMSAGAFSYGGHTIGHRLLDTLEEGEAIREIQGSLDRIAAETGSRPESFSYPKGRDAARVRSWLSRCGVTLAVTTDAGANRENCDPLALHRRDAGYLALGDRFSAHCMDLEMIGIADWWRA